MLAVEMRGVTKRFGNFVALDNVDLQVEQGEIHCLLGENGAGKSTLMNVLFGLYSADEGRVLINGAEPPVASPLVSHELGLGMVHQHFMLVETLSVWENVVLGSEPGGFVLDAVKAQKVVQDLSDTFNFNLDVSQPVEELSVGMKQRVEILKTLYRGATTIIFDEPTAVLAPPEVTQFLDILRGMRASGKTIIFITHKLAETMAVSDRVTVLRHGKVVGTVNTAQVQPEQLTTMMVGHHIEVTTSRKPHDFGGVVLSCKGLRLLPNAEKPVSFDIHEGEVLGFAGVDGNGQQELEELVLGLQRCSEGSIEIMGTDVTHRNTRARLGMGIGYIPSDRYRHAILPTFSLLDNYLLGNQYNPDYVKRGIIDFSNLEARSRELMEQYDVRASGVDQQIGSLSGGNQQKMVLSREAGKDTKLIVACQPVRGLDIGAINFVHQVILTQRNLGRAVLLISAELSDIRALSDRIAVLYKGEILDIRENEGFSEEELGLRMAGKRIQGGDAR